MKKCLCVFFMAFLILFLACKTQQPVPDPAPEKEELPSGVLQFERIEADSISRIRLCFSFVIENPQLRQLTAEIKDWDGLLNGIDFNRETARLLMDGTVAKGTMLSIEPQSSIQRTLTLVLELTEIPDNFGVMAEDEYVAELAIDLAYRYGSGNLDDQISVSAVFPRIREPRFTITSIAIMQAELINTRFKVSLRIDNPNMFPVVLSALGYELYGEGRFWADGREKEVLYIPARGSSETSLFLMMNFINMKRTLLDEIIAMQLVRYRFTGKAEVGTGVSWLPSFHMDFDRSGNSVVLK